MDWNVHSWDRFLFLIEDGPTLHVCGLTRLDRLEPLGRGCCLEMDRWRARMAMAYPSSPFSALGALRLSDLFPNSFRAPFQYRARSPQARALDAPGSLIDLRFSGITGPECCLCRSNRMGRQPTRPSACL